jgi:hypothetical protein
MNLIDVRSWHIAQQKFFGAAAYKARVAKQPKKRWKKLYEMARRHAKMAEAIKTSIGG